MNVESSTCGPTQAIFCTPENKQYYSVLQYESLDKKGKEIRLIKILPSEDSPRGVIRCELLQKIPVDDVRNKFTALSYCAGSAQKTKAIIVNQQKCNVFANLCHALLECRHFWSQHNSGEEFLLWTDQICIHQPDSKERAHQVSFMGDIYRAAKRTLICLATQDCDARGFNWIQKVLTLPIRGPFKTDDKEFLRGWLEFLDIVASPWWLRAWVFQEYILSQQPIFLYGYASMPWDEFEVKLEKVFGYLRSAYFSRSYDHREVPLSDRDLYIKDLFQNSGQAEEQVNKFLTRKDEFRKFTFQCKLLSGNR